MNQLFEGSGKRFNSFISNVIFHKTQIQVFQLFHPFQHLFDHGGTIDTDSVNSASKSKFSEPSQAFHSINN
jgi:hypothetical protein